MKSRNVVIVALAWAILVASPAWAQAADESAAGQSNVLLTITLGEVQKGPQRTYRLVTTSGAPARMIVGWRTPIPTVSAPENAGEEPVTSYVYQNVGMTARLRATVAAKGRIRVDGDIEISGSRESEMKENVAGMPVIGTFQQQIDVLLTLGKALRIAEVPDLEGGQRYLEITATVMD